MNKKFVIFGFIMISFSVLELFATLPIHFNFNIVGDDVVFFEKINKILFPGTVYCIIVVSFLKKEFSFGFYL
jgi:hypothetical protein